jgi:single-strand DNA-binding protein
MGNFNKVLLMGNLTRDPEMRGDGDHKVCKFGVAVNRVWKNQAGEKQEEVCFVDVVVFGRTAENCNQYLRKGRPVFIDGRLHYDSWDDRETGKKRNKIEVVAENVQFLGSREDGGGQGGGGSGGGQQQERGSSNSGGNSGGQSSGQSNQSSKPAGDEVNFDDIPF